MAYQKAGFLGRNESEKPESLSTWITTIIACAYIAWHAVSLYYSTREFNELYRTLNAHLNGLSWFVMNAYRWFYPSLFGGMATLLITKQLFVGKRWLSLSITLAAIVLLEIIGAWIVWALYAPIENLGR